MALKSNDELPLRVPQARPGTRRVTCVEENTAADSIELNVEQVERLNTLTPAAGDRHNEANIASIDR